MSLLVATTVAALLIASPAASDVDQLAANGGFLIGSASRCGIASVRVARVGQLVLDLIAAASSDARERQDATVRYARFFIAAALADPAKDKLVASCPLVSREFGRLERHQFPAVGSDAPSGGTNTRPRPADGE